MKLSKDAKHWHQFWSVRLSIMAAVLGALEATLPLWQQAIPPGAFASASTAVAMLAAATRVIKQTIKGRDDV